MLISELGRKQANRGTKMKEGTIMDTVLQTNIAGMEPSRGKVRDIYDLGDKLLIIATDRISAFDVVMANGIPYKLSLIHI